METNLYTPVNSNVSLSKDLLNLISLEALKCERENGKILLISFTLRNTKFDKGKLLQLLNNNFRIYDIISEYPNNIFNTFVVSYKPSPINFQIFLKRLHSIVNHLDIDKSNLVYTFKIYPYDGVNIGKLLELNLKELLKLLSPKNSSSTL